MTSHQQALFATDLAPACETGDIDAIKEVMDPYFYQLLTARSLFYVKDERYDKPFFLRSRDFLGKAIRWRLNRLSPRPFNTRCTCSALSEKLPVCSEVVSFTKMRVVVRSVSSMPKISSILP